MERCELASGPWRVSAALRLDDIDLRVSSHNPQNSGSKNEAFLSPKVTLAYRVSLEVELYADLGRGYHSNDARGVVQHAAPVTLEPVDPRHCSQQRTEPSLEHATRTAGS
jgi:outer membrane receptor protein involved in Fe transport